MEHNTITHTLVPESTRADYVGNLFGMRFLWVESFVFDNAGALCADYDGGYWEYFSLSNGGFYMAPTCGDHFSVACSNGFEGELSPEAFGITSCLYAYSLLSFSSDDVFARKCAEMYHRLRGFAMQHAEATFILSAID